MFLRLFITIIIASFILVGCTVATPSDTNANANENTNREGELINENINTNINTNTNTSTENLEPAASDSPVADSGFISYTNKAMGYTLDAPAKWYWQHYIRTQIGDVDPLVDDLFITDRKPLKELTKEYSGEIVIEVSRHQVSDFDSSISGFDKKEVKIDTIDASGYTGLRDNIKIIEYIFTKAAKTYRIIYTKVSSTPEEEKIFEKAVSSFKFGS